MYHVCLEVPHCGLVDVFADVDAEHESASLMLVIDLNSFSQASPGPFSIISFQKAAHVYHGATVVYVR